MSIHVRFFVASSILLAAVAGCGGGSETTTSSGTSSTTGQGGSGGGTTSSTGTGGNTTSSSSSSSSGTGTAGMGGMGGMGGAGGAGGGTSSSSTTGGGMACVWGADTCGAGFYCDAPGCKAGTCAPLGAQEEAKKEPVCGCDGLPYWNASVAKKQGMSVESAGVCAQLKTCGGFGNLKCPQGATCSYELPDPGTCGAVDFGGSCWMMPAACGASGAPKSRACGSPLCADQCDLIKQEVNWYQDNSCP